MSLQRVASRVVRPLWYRNFANRIFAMCTVVYLVVNLAHSPCTFSVYYS